MSCAGARSRFRKLAPPDDGDVVALAEKIIRRIAKILARYNEDRCDDQVSDARVQA